MKKIISYITIGLIVVLGILCTIQYISNKRLTSDYEISKANEKSLWNRLNGTGEKILVYQATIDNLKHTGDSVVQNLLTQQERLKIRNKELQGMISIGTGFHTHDTVTIHDTLFKDPTLCWDTTIADKWRSVDISLRYPSFVGVGTRFISQKDVYITAKRETIDPPKKFFLFRWFQKKHTVARVIIHEENPYVDSTNNLFIKVVE